MFRAMIRRTLLSVLILFLVAVFVFLATEVLPGDALDVYLSEDDVSVMTQEDIEEIYAIVVTKPTYVHVVKDFHEANLPGEYE